jgi:hypothetical protein
MKERIHGLLGFHLGYARAICDAVNYVKFDHNARPPSRYLLVSLTSKPIRDDRDRNQTMSRTTAIGREGANFNLSVFRDTA